MLNPRPEKIELHERIMKEWLVSDHMKVDEVHAEAEVEDPLAEYEVPQLEAEEPLAEDDEPHAEAEQP